MGKQEKTSKSAVRLSAFSHDVKNVITSAKINIAVLGQKLAKDHDESVMAILKRIDARLDEIVEKVSAFRKKEETLTP